MFDALQENIESVIVMEDKNSLENINARLEETQKELLKRANAKQNYNDVADEIERLRELKQDTLAKNAECEGQKQRIYEMKQYLKEQTRQIQEYDDSLVRRMIEKITVYDNSIVIKRAIDNEYVNPEKKESCFNAEVLKTLFMIKYVKEIKANVENITSLMVSYINEDRLELKTKVEEALGILVKQTLVQKIGDTYVFLTNEELEINIAIERTPVEPSEKTHRIAELVFEKIYDINKYKFPQMNGRYSFSFNQIVDDMPFKNNQNYPMLLRILTPNGDNPDDSTTLRLMSGQENSVLVVLPEDRAFIDEITLALQIRKYMNGGNNEGIKKYESIIAEKKNELRDHERNSELFLEESLRNADIYVNGDLLKTSAKEPATRINEALGKLVKNIYHKLSYIDTPVTALDVENIFKSENQLTLDSSNANPNINALNDMYNYILSESGKHTRISLKMITSHFMAAPYGFVEVDVQWLIAKLFKNGKLEFWLNNESITIINRTTQEIIKFITRKEYLEKLMINIKKQMQNLKKL